MFRKTNKNNWRLRKEQLEALKVLKLDFKQLKHNFVTLKDQLNKEAKNEFRELKK